MPEQAETQTVSTTETTEQTAAQRTEAAEDAWLSSNIIEDDTEAKAVHDHGDEDPSQHTDDEPSEPSDTAGESDDTDTTAPEGDTATGETDEDLARALSALRRDGTPQKTIDAMLKDEDGINELKEWGLKRAKVHSDIDRKLSESKRSEVTDPSESPKDEGGDSDTAEPAEPRRNNLADAVEKFKDEFGEDAASAFESFAHSVSDEAEARIRKFEADNNITRSYMERIMLREARENVAKDFPQLKDDTAYKAVEAKVRSLVKTGDYQDAETAMRDAALTVLGPELLRKAKPALEQSRRLKNGGNPTVKTHKAPASSMTPEERENAALEMIFEGKDADSVRKALSGPGV